MATPEHLDPLPLPNARAWESIGVVCGPELHGGYQSRVFAADRGGDAVVVKLTDGRLADHAYARRLEMTAALAEIDPSVVGPLTLESGLFARLGDWLAAVSPFVTGRAPAVDDERDVRRMAATLAGLHRSMSRIEPVDLPAVAALADTDLPADVDLGRPQMLHGDFSHTNLMFSDRRVRVFDFDDCGYGSVEFEVGNTLYMVLFDAAMSSELRRYERFRDWFVGEYRSMWGHAVRDDLLEASIELRVRALGRWVDRPETAPIGIRTATPAWRESLRAFVTSHGDR